MEKMKIAPENKKLYEALVDFLYESQLKLGFADIPIRLYYPRESLSRLLGEEASRQRLSDFLSDPEIRYRLGEITVEAQEEQRFCLVIPPQGSVYVRDHVKVQPFLSSFVKLIADHRPLSEIDALFSASSPSLVRRKFWGEDFDWLYYFADGIPDRYYYCLKEEPDGDVIYHRFLKEDYLDVFGESH